MANTNLIGTTFRYAVADSNPLHKVVSIKSGICKCVVIEGEWKGRVAYLNTAQIKAFSEFENFMQKSTDSNAAWWKAQKLGSIIHYDNGFNNFVRLAVIEKDGKKMGQPIALVGNWRKYDLPSRLPNGEIYYPYHAEKIINRTGAWQPHISCVFESPSFGKRNTKGALDPTNLKPIVLKVKGMDAKKVQKAKLVQAMEKIEPLLEKTKDPKATLKKIKALVDAALKAA